MEHVTTAEARQRLAELLNRVAFGKERFVVTRHGKELVAIVPLEEVTLLDRLRASLSRGDLDAAWADVGGAETGPWDDPRRDME
jgi:prevent-host-death family protein